MIADTITKKIQEAMKAKDEARLSTLKMLSSALSYEKIALQHPLSEEEELSVVQKEAKIRKDAIEALRQSEGKQTTSTEKEVENKIKKAEAELQILHEYLPKEMSDEELEKLVSNSISRLKPEGMRDMGKVIGAVKAKTGMRADGAKIAQLVKKALETR